MKSDKRLSRRDALVAGATMAAGAAAAGSLVVDAQAQDVRRFATLPTVDQKHRILFKGGTIISMDAKVGDLAKGDVLIEGSKIAAIGPDLNVSRAWSIAIAIRGRRSFAASIPIRQRSPTIPTRPTCHSPSSTGRRIITSAII
jgi:hypothetical protein